jgi:hypothetical protein
MVSARCPELGVGSAMPLPASLFSEPPVVAGPMPARSAAAYATTGAFGYRAAAALLNTLRGGECCCRSATKA